jgi:hypothetical protein
MRGCHYSQASLSLLKQHLLPGELQTQIQNCIGCNVVGKKTAPTTTHELWKQEVIEPVPGIARRGGCENGMLLHIIRYVSLFVMNLLINTNYLRPCCCRFLPQRPVSATHAHTCKPSAHPLTVQAIVTFATACYTSISNTASTCDLW